MSRSFRLGAGVLICCAALGEAVAADGGKKAATPSGHRYLLDPREARTEEQRFLHMAVKHAGQMPQSVERAVPRLRRIEQDLPVALLLARESNRGVDEIAAMRERGSSWNDVFTKAGVRHDVLYRGIDRSPGQLLGSVWNQWPVSSLMSDDDICRLALVQLAHGMTGQSAWDLARKRSIADVYIIVTSGGWEREPRRSPRDEDDPYDRHDRRSDHSGGPYDDRGGYSGPCDQDIPKGHLPPPGKCRVWQDDLPPGHQPPPTDCSSAYREARRTGGRVIHGECGGEGHGRGDHDRGDRDRGDRDQDRDRDHDRDQAGDEIVICHIPPGNPSARHTITIGAPAWHAHRGHGDTYGPCR
jgi:hypothetical protein